MSNEQLLNREVQEISSYCTPCYAILVVWQTLQCFVEPLINKVNLIKRKIENGDLIGANREAREMQDCIENVVAFVKIEVLDLEQEERSNYERMEGIQRKKGSLDNEIHHIHDNVEDLILGVELCTIETSRNESLIRSKYGQLDKERQAEESERGAANSSWWWLMLPLVGIPIALGNNSLHTEKARVAAEGRKKLERDCAALRERNSTLAEEINESDEKTTTLVMLLSQLDCEEQQLHQEVGIVKERAKDCRDLICFLEELKITFNGTELSTDRLLKATGRVLELAENGKVIRSKTLETCAESVLVSLADVSKLCGSSVQSRAVKE